MIETVTFLEPRFVGKRFEDHALPLDILRDLASLESFFCRTVTHLYFAEHPDRQRLPRNFFDGISVKLVSIEEGSVIPKLVLFVSCASAGLFPPPTQTYYEQARDSLINAIEAAHENRAVAGILPESLLGYFEQIGRGLLDDESIEFRKPGAEKKAVLNRETRKRLILASSKTQTYTEEIERLIGAIPEADQDKNTFTILTTEGEKVQAPLDQINREVVFKAFNRFCDGEKVTVKGIGQYNRAGKLLKLDSIEEIQLLDELDIELRLSELLKLKNGWMDGKGKAIEPSSTEWLIQGFCEHYEANIPLPRLFPTLEGGVQAEWTIGSQEITLEFDLIGKKGFYQSLDSITSTATDEMLDFSEPETWKKLNELLIAAMGIRA